MIGIGSIIGAGIFVYAGTAAAEHAGPAVLLSFVIAGIGCLFAGLCYAEFASMIPESGSSYTYAYATMGRFMAWFIGWNMVLEYGVSASGVAAGWSGYFVSFLQTFRDRFSRRLRQRAAGRAPAFGDLHLTGAVVNLPAVVLIVALTALLVVGVQRIGAVQRRDGADQGRHRAARHPVRPALCAYGATSRPSFRPTRAVRAISASRASWPASGIVFFAYIGFEAVSVAAQECKNPERDLPIGILGSLVHLHGALHPDGRSC